MNDVESKLSIFISHRAPEDTPIANSFIFHLNALVRDLVEIKLCEHIPGGVPWRDWIRSNVSGTDVFVLLYTREDADWSWCLWEAAFFQGSTGGNRPMVGIKAPGIAPPNVFSDLQFYDGDEKGLRAFLIDFIVRGKFTSDKPVSRSIISNKGDILDEALDHLANNFSHALIRTDYFTDRIVFEFQPVSADEAIQRLGETKVSNFEFVARNSKIKASPETLRIAGCPGNLRTWTELQNSLVGVEWIIEMRELVTSTIPGLEAELNYTDRQTFTAFVSNNGFRYLPIIGRIDRSGNWPLFVSVYLVRQSLLVDESTDMVHRGVPRPYITIALLLRMSRVFRWHFVEPLIQTLKTNLDLPTERMREWNDLKHEIAPFMAILERLEAEGKSRGLTNWAFVAADLGFDDEDAFGVLWREYGNRRGELGEALAAGDQALLLAVLDQLLDINKRFLVILVDIMRQQVLRLRPREKPLPAVTDSASSPPASAPPAAAAPAADPAASA